MPVGYLVMTVAMLVPLLLSSVLLLVLDWRQTW